MTSTVVPSHRGLSRRDVLWTATLTGAAVLVGSGPSVVTPLRRLVEQAGPRLSVGFIDDHLAEPSQLMRGTTVVPASQVRPTVGRGAGALVEVGGLTGVDGLTGSVKLDALLPHPDPLAIEPLRFAAFTARGGDVPMVSLPSSVDAALADDPGLGFELAATGPDGTTITSTVFTDADGDGNPGLRSGTYLLSLQPDRWASTTRVPAADDPAWADLASILVSVLPRP